MTCRTCQADGTAVVLTLSTLAVCCRGAALDEANAYEPTLWKDVEEEPPVADPTSKRSRLLAQACNIAGKRIVLHLLEPFAFQV